MMPYLKTTALAIFWGWFLGIVIPRWTAAAQGAPVVRFGEARWIGWPIALLGGALCLVCVFSFAHQGKGTPAPFDPPKKLVVWGPYRWVRNPIYLGAALLVLGLVIRSDAVKASFLGWLAFVWVGVNLFVLLYEEPTLRAKFGPEYEEYYRSVPRWIPRVPRRAARP